MMITKVMTLESVQLVSWPPIYLIQPTNQQGKHHIAKETLHFSPFLSGNIRMGVSTGAVKLNEGKDEKKEHSPPSLFDENRNAETGISTCVRGPFVHRQTVENPNPQVARQDRRDELSQVLGAPALVLARNKSGLIRLFSGSGLFQKQSKHLHTVPEHSASVGSPIRLYSSAECVAHMI